MVEKEKAGNLMKNITKPKVDTLDYGYKVLSNGLKVLLISDPETTKSSAALAVNIGSLANKNEEQGLAHFCEHLLFMGNKKYPTENDYLDYLAKNGGKSNAATSLDNTLFYFYVSNEAYEEALEQENRNIERHNPNNGIDEENYSQERTNRNLNNNQKQKSSFINKIKKILIKIKKTSHFKLKRKKDNITKKDSINIKINNNINNDNEKDKDKNKRRR